MKLKKLFTWAFLPLSALTLFSIAFVNADQVIDKDTISYDCKITTQYYVDPNDLARMNELEKGSLNVTEEEQNVVITRDANDDLTTVTTVKSSKGNEGWIKPAAKIVVNKSGVTFFDKQGRATNSFQPTRENGDEYQAVKQKVLDNGFSLPQDIKPLSADDISTIKRQGMTVQNLDGGIVKISSPTTEMLYDAPGKSYRISRIQNGKETNSIAQSYVQNEAGQLVPSIKQEVTHRVLESGICVAEVTTTTYSNYNLQSGPRR